MARCPICKKEVTQEEKDKMTSSMRNYCEATGTCRECYIANLGPTPTERTAEIKINRTGFKN